MGMNPVLKLWGNILGCGFFVAFVVVGIANPLVEGTWRWLGIVCGVLGVLGHWRGARLARQEQLER
ncbi:MULTISPECIES: hypothetical protein [unclassified Streptomyces]|uniref:hypothetical protein n=1 Tax=unclassified Streptomyces TaxID=2593676 RepID=UPI002DD9CC51|nr:hypothetical protein [Streptomyces sp. NBC_01750]WSB05015.1 hypothetical protein OIE54_40905 [Streptomyces sp. NBC_01794]WSD30715.1 hypothetical protein OG966_01220 [Streptomyces sp. NBC_01750]